MCACLCARKPFSEPLVVVHTARYENPLKFSGKELDDITGLYDHGARSRNPVSTLWYGIDPLFEKYPDFSPYNYCAGNPVKYFDPDGMEKLIFYDVTMYKPLNYYLSKSLNGEYNYKQDKRRYDQNINLLNYANQYSDNDNVLHIFFHGNHESFATEEGLIGYGKGCESDPYYFLFQNSKLFNDNVVNNKTTLLVMHSCSTGSGDGSIAQKLSEEAGAELIVIAPSANVHVSFPNNKESVYEDGIAWNHQGSWNIYYKGKLVDELNGLDERWFDFGPWARGKAVDLQDYLKKINVEELKQKYEQKISK